MFTVGLTGGIGSGKSAVSACLAARGALLIDADQVARDVVAPGTPGLAAVLAEFGTELANADGGLDREALGRIVFADPAARGRLEAIVHPLIREETARRMGEVSPSGIAVHDIPLLVEVHAEGTYDVVLVVEAPRELRLHRLEGRGLPRDQALARMANQATDSQRRAAADIVVDNGGSLDDLDARIEEVWQDLLARRDAKATAKATAKAETVASGTDTAASGTDTAAPAG
ncbi:dephospho-CoA kinase [Frankia sp. CcI156]|uniref:Dephospho-CoA kinase n=1 Tax=Frankia casuarinae (strain DSM 45818 / CECT 9043 / HFP020203 / CcI3) TaxID=106370 RepID=COAE_FRACC|nr:MULTISPECIES: dephospho-CoA kinase [Frankia]Q2JCJ1.1 RecName: Full=Dephospho-CoA kinase; AltName: Full=Dephosphocoenzyme A kinase [Frankia casuarinae]ABD11001.1 dephospho-CoA kinase [Frankia casuarinae]ETA00667.1 dephospho-CoA kinase [Frankia sp. CcI6]EYT91375.1 dephospho-CoA kinase [Frankia casuarinae]KDA41781.1 dephospho-CoA kinase [Frankia sp. BMG5.23]KEZ37479.1 dephospho-CoA kinase [Frankia sp. CeD]